MKRLPQKLNQRQKLILEATKDFFGKGAPKKGLQRNIINVASWLMNRRKGIQLNKEEKSAVWCIKQNLTDKIYVDALNLGFDKGFGKDVPK